MFYKLSFDMERIDESIKGRTNTIYAETTNMDEIEYEDVKKGFFDLSSRSGQISDTIQQYNKPIKARASPYPPALTSSVPASGPHTPRQGAYPFLLPLLITQPQMEGSRICCTPDAGSFHLYGIDGGLYPS